MPRAARLAPGGMLFHVLNRGVGRMEFFSKEKNHAAFEDLLEQTRESRPMRICAYPRGWRKLVNQPQTEAEVERTRRCAARGQPYGGTDWARRTAKRLGLESTLRLPHRPRKTAAKQ